MLTGPLRSSLSLAHEGEGSRPKQLIIDDAQSFTNHLRAPAETPVLQHRSYAEL